MKELDYWGVSFLYSLRICVWHEGTYEEEMKKYKEQTEKSMSNALVDGIVRYLQHTGNIEKQ